VAQQHRQREITDDHLVGVQPPPQPALGAHHLLGALDDLAQQLVQLKTRQIREPQRAIGAPARSSPTADPIAEGTRRSRIGGCPMVWIRPVTDHQTLPRRDAVYQEILGPGARPEWRAVEVDQAAGGQGTW